MTQVQANSAASSAARRASNWLARSWRPAVGSDALVIEALALLHLCRALDPAIDTVKDLETAIAAASPEPVWTAADLSASLLAAAAAIRIGGTIAAHAETYLEALEDLDRDGLLTESGGALARIALHGPLPEFERRPALCEVDLRPDDSASLLAALDEIETVSRFGTITAVSDPATHTLLEGAAMAALRRYDLPLGMRTLRARSYLGCAPSLGLRTGFGFLRLLQKDDGSFGDLDATIGRLTAAGETDASLLLQLPITLHALWTLAELGSPPFRLARAALPRRRVAQEGTIHAVPSRG